MHSETLMLVAALFWLGWLLHNSSINEQWAHALSMAAWITSWNLTLFYVRMFYLFVFVCLIVCGDGKALSSREAEAGAAALSERSRCLLACFS